MNKNANMRLSRESRKVKKDFENQIKKHGKITDNYVCAPDPENPLVWYFVIFGLDDDYKGGYYFGKVVCPENYPATPPYIMISTNNGCFEQNEKICLSITDYHPESWNPAWNVTHIIIGCISFWLQDEETAGSLYYWEENDKTFHRQKAAWKSRESVLNEEKFKTCLEYYKPFIGICDDIKVDHWDKYIKLEEEQKAKKEAEAKAAAEAKAKAEEEAKIKAEKEAAEKVAAEAKAKVEAEEAAARQKVQQVGQAVKALVQEIYAEANGEKVEQVQNKLSAVLDKFKEEQIPDLEELQFEPLNMKQAKSLMDNRLNKFKLVETIFA